jgi:hypothetical protein
MKARDVLPMILTGTTASFIAGAVYIIDCRAAGGPVQHQAYGIFPLMVLRK